MLLPAPRRVAPCRPGPPVVPCARGSRPPRPRSSPTPATPSSASRHARGRQDHLRAARRPPDALRGARLARRRRGADDPHLPPVGARRRALRHPARAQPAQLGRARSRVTGTAWPSRTRRSPRAPAVHRRRCAERPTLLIADEPHHMGEDATWGRTTIDAFARARFRLLLSGTPFRSDNSPIPWVVVRRRGRLARRTTTTATRRRWSTASAGPVTFHTYGGDMEWVSDGRRPARGLRRRAARAGGRAAAAHGAGPGGRLDHARAARRRRGAADDPRRRPSRRGRPGRRDRQGARRASSPTGSARITGERPDIVHSDARRRVGADRALLVGVGALAGVRADGLRGRRRAAPAGRRVRDDGADRAVLPPGDRALHPPHAGAEGADERTSSCRPIRG